jgi:hypothetical protein
LRRSRSLIGAMSLPIPPAPDDSVPSLSPDTLVAIRCSLRRSLLPGSSCLFVVDTKSFRATDSDMSVAVHRVYLNSHVPEGVIQCSFRSTQWAQTQVLTDRRDSQNLKKTTRLCLKSQSDTATLNLRITDSISARVSIDISVFTPPQAFQLNLHGAGDSHFARPHSRQA